MSFDYYEIRRRQEKVIIFCSMATFFAAILMVKLIFVMYDSYVAIERGLDAPIEVAQKMSDPESIIGQITLAQKYIQENNLLGEFYYFRNKPSQSFQAVYDALEECKHALEEAQSLQDQASSMKILEVKQSLSRIDSIADYKLYKDYWWAMILCFIGFCWIVIFLYAILTS